MQLPAGHSSPANHHTRRLEAVLRPFPSPLCTSPTQLLTTLLQRSPPVARQDPQLHPSPRRHPL